MAPPHPPVARASLLKLPAFLLSLFVFYWSLSLSAVLYRVRFLHLGDRRNDLFAWADTLRRFFGVRVLAVGRRRLHRAGPCVYLANHRCWADFFLDAYLSEGRAALMARYMVAAAFPFFMAATANVGATLLFKRGAVADKAAFNAWLERRLAAGPHRALLVFPEGHRSLRPRSLPLRRGMLYYAHSRRLPVQVIASAGKEAVFCERTLDVNFGRTVVAAFSEPLRPEDFADFEAFAAAAQAAWDAAWDAAHAPPPGEPLEPLVPQPPAHEYTPLMQALQLVSMSASIAVLAAVLWYGAAAALWALGAFGGAYRNTALSLLAGLLLASIGAAHSRDPLQRRPTAAAGTASAAAAAAAAASISSPAAAAAADVQQHSNGGGGGAAAS
jgi:1-acyl-sn-glycerol-3-phosphate acyltransferase